MDRDALWRLIHDETMESGDVAPYLGISPRRLTQLAQTGVLVPVRRGIYLRCDVEARREDQEALRAKFGRGEQG